MEDIIMKKCMIALLITIFLNGVCFAATDAGLIVDTAYVKDKTGKPGWVIIDASFPDDYKEGTHSWCNSFAANVFKGVC